MADDARPVPPSLRRQDWALYVSFACLVGAGALHERPWWVVAFGVGGVAATLEAKRLSRRSPEPLPYTQRWMLELTRPFFPARRLRRGLEPRPGERILEVGPGTGRHALAVARTVGPSGTLDVLDLQTPMLAAVSRRAAKGAVDNIASTVGDVRALPWEDATFDAAYLVTVLGEVPGRCQALSELHRTLRRGGRLVVGEMIMDPDNVGLRTLRAEAESVGFVFDRVFGPRAAYVARFARP